jgi:hypothetical protein
MPELHYIIGDATEPIKRPAVLPHCCNDAAGWGRGYVLALSAKYPEPERAYREWFKIGSYKELGKPELGKCQIVQVKPDIWVANIIGQHGTQYVGKTPPIRYEAIEEGLKTANQFATEKGATIHSPRLGAVLAGGSWPELENIIKRTVTVETYIYTLPNQAWKWKDAYENPDDAWKGNPVKPL